MGGKKKVLVFSFPPFNRNKFQRHSFTKSLVQFPVSKTFVAKKFVTHRFSTLHLLCCSCLALLLFFLSLSSFSVAETPSTRNGQPGQQRKENRRYVHESLFVSFLLAFSSAQNPSSPNRLRTTNLISVPRFLLLCFSPAQNLSRPQNPFCTTNP